MKRKGFLRIVLKIVSLLVCVLLCATYALAADLTTNGGVELAVADLSHQYARAVKAF